MDARLQAVSSRNMYSLHGLLALIRPLCGQVCHALMVESYWSPGSALRQAANAIRSWRVRLGRRIVVSHPVWPRGGLVAEEALTGENGRVTLPNLDIENLTAEERLALIEKIWDSLTPDDVGLTDAQRDELERRLDDLERNPDQAVPWAEARRRILERGS